MLLRIEILAQEDDQLEITPEEAVGGIRETETRLICGAIIS